MSSAEKVLTSIPFTDAEKERFPWNTFDGPSAILARPLSFDRVQEGVPVTSTFPLFHLPYELFHEITQHLQPRDLASLALVDPDCRQLARSCQFANVVFDYSTRKMELLTRLVEEGAKSLSYFRQRSISACIRRVAIVTNPREYNLRHGLGNHHWFARNEDERAARDYMIQLRWRARRDYVDNEYVPKLVFIFHHALRHLETLDCAGINSSISPNIMWSIIHAPVQNLRLGSLELSQSFEVPLPLSSAPNRWRIRSLELDITNSLEDLHISDDRNVLFSVSIVVQAAPTLEEFHWNARTGGGPFLFDNALSFPCLRHLALRRVQHDENFLRAALPRTNCQLISLSFDEQLLQDHGQYLLERGHITSLTTLHIYIPRHSWTEKHTELLCSFVLPNPQLEQFASTFAMDPLAIESRILPTLTSAAFSLRSLHLVWDSAGINRTSLRLLGGLHNLTQLHLSAGSQFGWRHDWFVDHVALREALLPVKELRRLSFSRDTYENLVIGGRTDNYYGEKGVPAAVLQSIKASLSAHERQRLEDMEHLEYEAWEISQFERLHLERVLEEAAKYVEQFSHLHFIVLGMRPMIVELQEGVLQRMPIPITNYRDDFGYDFKRYWGVYIA